MRLSQETAPLSRRVGTAPRPGPWTPGPEGRDQLPQLWQHLGDVRRGGSQLPPHVVRVLRLKVGPQELDPRPVRRRPPGLPAASPEHGDPLVPWRSTRTHPPAGSCRCRARPRAEIGSRDRRGCCRAAFELGELPVLSDEDRARRARCGHRSIEVLSWFAHIADHPSMGKGGPPCGDLPRSRIASQTAGERPERMAAAAGRAEVIATPRSLIRTHPEHIASRGIESQSFGELHDRAKPGPSVRRSRSDESSDDRPCR